ncbi:ATP-binding protein [Cohnella massiliensis]|uniref:ATP-binding protein n=1 Tax=Cohnella massiliensis TaxID=1816691 RepID=UPI0009BB1C40|nr:ATP-binding protein [Cohnella massiliensis]
MSVGRKLFAALSLFIAGMGLVFAFTTQLVVRDALRFMVQTAKQDEIGRLSGRLLDEYRSRNGSWAGIREFGESAWRDSSDETDRSFLLQTPDGDSLVKAGTASDRAIERFGIRTPLEHNGRTVAVLYYWDEEADFLSKLRIGIVDSTRVLLLFGVVLFVVVSMLVAFWLSRRLTAPLRALVPAIDRLGKGEYGVQAPVLGKDEYGKVANAFNRMSERLRQSDEARRHLVADVAHELRTPITIIQGKLDLLQQRGQSVPPEALLPVQDDLLRLTRLVSDLHQLSLAEAKKLPLVLQPVDMAEQVRKIMERLAPEFDAKRLTGTLDNRAARTTLNADAHRIAQVLLNLLTNAVRYTPEGGTIRIGLADEPGGTGPSGGQDGGGALRIDVTDSGIGIAPEHLPFLFDRFYRTDEARDRHRGGSGLGLAIAKQFVEAHGGTIAVASREGQGTTFSVFLPISPFQQSDG